MASVVLFESYADSTAHGDVSVEATISPCCCSVAANPRCILHCVCVGGGGCLRYEWTACAVHRVVFWLLNPVD